MKTSKSLLKEIKHCQICKDYLPFPPKPILSFNANAKILIIGQAPGKRVHETGIPWNDSSGDRLRDWMGLDKSIFYDPNIIAIVPMGFCYPGKGKSGDLPPRPECAQKWMQPILKRLKKVQLTLLIGQYAQSYILRDYNKVRDYVKNFKNYYPTQIPLPHPSPRNNLWMKKNPWFEKSVLPFLQKRLKTLL